MPSSRNAIDDTRFPDLPIISRGNTGHHQPMDVAYGVLYLGSDESTFVTGAELVIDGGYTAQ